MVRVIMVRVWVAIRGGVGAIEPVPVVVSSMMVGMVGMIVFAAGFLPVPQASQLLEQRAQTPACKHVEMQRQDEKTRKKKTTRMRRRRRRKKKKKKKTKKKRRRRRRRRK